MTLETPLALPELTALERSALLTVISRARDAEWKAPILDDAWSVVVRDGLAVDWDGLGMPRKEAFTVATRGRILDDLCRDFIRRHPDAVVIELGSGLDDRAVRVAPPVSVTWIDVDFAPVHRLRRQLGARPVGEHHVERAADATGDDWLDAVPRGRAVMMIADGFFPFLPEEQSARLVRRVVELSRSGELAMNGYSTLARRLMPRVRAIRDLHLDVTAGTAFDDPAAPEAWHPRVRFADRFMLTRSRYVERMPAGLRTAIRVMNWFPALADRSDMGVLRYTF